MGQSTESRSTLSVTETLERVERRPLSELLENRIRVEEHFAKLGHTYRHGAFYRAFEHRIVRPTLRAALELSGLYGRGLQNAISPVVKRIEMQFPDLPEGLDGFEILHLSDFHIDGTPGLAKALTDTLKALRPDVCVLTGDYRFEDRGSCEAVYPLMAEVLSSIQARLGIFGILGNHDVSDIAFWLEDLGVRMLVNEAAGVGAVGPSSLWILGVDDPFDYRCDDLEKARSGVPAGSFQVLLAHAPEIFEQAANAGVSLYLSGHTHGGQIRIPGVGSIRHNAKCPREYAQGHWRHGNMQGYTSSGVGCSSLPVRFNCPPEIVMITLRRLKSGREALE